MPLSRGISDRSLRHWAQYAMGIASPWFWQVVASGGLAILEAAQNRLILQ
jgi:hypothetical protein